MDNPSLDQVASSAWDDQVSPEPSNETVEVSQPEPSVVTNPVEVETPKVEDKPTEESFSKIDPETLPDELKATYKSLQADYTKKRQAETAKLREYEQRIKELEETRTGGEKLTPEEHQKELVREAIREEQAEAWRTAAKAEIDNVDPRLNENHPDYEKTKWLDLLVRERLESELHQYEEEHGTPVGFDHVGKAKEYLDSFDKYAEDYAKAYLQKQSILAKEKADKTSKASPDVTNPTTRMSGNMSIEDSIEAAFNNS